MSYRSLALKTLLSFLLALTLWSCGSTEGGFDEDFNLVSEIDEAIEDFSEEGEGGEVLSEGDREKAQEEYEEDYVEGEEIAEEDFDEEDFDEEDFDEEDFGGEKGGEGEEIAEEDFGDEEGGNQRVAQQEGQEEGPILEALDESSEEAFNEPPIEIVEEEGNDVAASEVAVEEDMVDEVDSTDAADMQAKNPEDLEGVPVEVVANSGADDYMEEEAMEESVSHQGQQGWVPVKKIKEVPFYRNGRLLNTVYIFRDDLALSSVSIKIYGDDRSAQLLKDNPHLARGADPGDKLYYNSPNRPEDSNKMKVAYEDMNMLAQEYVTQAGDNIRAFSAQLLGFPNAWKEVWATNPAVESKTGVAEGLILRYWKDDIGSLNTKLTASEKQPELDDTGVGNVAKDFNSGFGGGQAAPSGGLGSEGQQQTTHMASMAAGAVSPSSPLPPPPSSFPKESSTSAAGMVVGEAVVAAPPPPAPPPPPPPAPMVGQAATTGGGGQKRVSTAHPAKGTTGMGSGMGWLGDRSTLIYVALVLLGTVAIFIKRRKAAQLKVFDTTQVG